MHVHRSHGKSRSTTGKQNGSAEDTFLQKSSSCTSNIKNSSSNEVNMTDTNTTSMYFEILFNLDGIIVIVIGIVGDTAEDPDEEITEVFKCTCCGIWSLCWKGGCCFENDNWQEIALTLNRGQTAPKTNKAKNDHIKTNPCGPINSPTKHDERIAQTSQPMGCLSQ